MSDAHYFVTFIYSFICKLFAGNFLALSVYVYIYICRKNNGKLFINYTAETYLTMSLVCLETVSPLKTVKFYSLLKFTFNNMTLHCHIGTYIL